MFSPDTLNDLEPWQQTFVADAIAAGCSWIQTGYNFWYLNTGSLGRADAKGSFNIRIFGNANPYFSAYYVRPGMTPDDPRTVNCGDIKSEKFDLDDIIRQAGTCPQCGRYVGIDNTENVSWAGRACSSCAPAVQDEFKDYIKKNGTD